MHFADPGDSTDRKERKLSFQARQSCPIAIKRKPLLRNRKSVVEHRETHFQVTAIVQDCQAPTNGRKGDPATICSSGNCASSSASPETARGLGSA